MASAARNNQRTSSRTSHHAYATASSARFAAITHTAAPRRLIFARTCRIGAPCTSGMRQEWHRHALLYHTPLPAYSNLAACGNTHAHGLFARAAWYVPTRTRTQARAIFYAPRDGVSAAHTSQATPHSLRRSCEATRIAPQSLRRVAHTCDAHLTHHLAAARLRAAACGLHALAASSRASFASPRTRCTRITLALHSLNRSFAARFDNDVCCGALADIFICAWLPRAAAAVRSMTVG